jgi:siderophore synthetase component
MNITLEPLDLNRDLGLLHSWVTHPRSAFWMMQNASIDDVAGEYSKIIADPHQHVHLGRMDGTPAFLVETYDPSHSPLADRPELRPGDIGLHLLVGPPAGRPQRGFTRAVFRAAMEHCFADPAVRRVVVEPDVGNDRIRAKNVEAGFVELGEITMPDKTAMLSACTREQFVRASAPGAHLAHPRVGDHFARAQRHLIGKAIAEYAHERMITPESDGPDRYLLSGPASSYAFSARRYPLDHWVLDPDSITRTVDGGPAPLDVQELVAEFAPQLGIPAELLPTYLEELASTLSSAVWKLQYSRTPVAELLDADLVSIESAMTEGHPAFVANNGRIGFGADDYLEFAPETGQPVQLVWLAARRDATTLALGSGLDERQLYGGELGAETIMNFRAVLSDLGLEPDDYQFLPVHPWQWVNKLAVTFAPDLARRQLVYLGQGEDNYRAQQSIRTFFNSSRPERHYVKTALAIQNMGFLRGLSPAYMAATPAINDWVFQTVDDDFELRACGFTVLRELASIGYTGDAFHRLQETSPYQKMIAALWRESPVPKLADGERLASMAALLHRDAAGDALVTAMIKNAPLEGPAWLRSYLRAYLRPLIHCLYAYDLAFMPHGENLIMVLSEQVPVRMIIKDIGEEVAVLSERELPPGIERIRAAVPDDVKALAVHTDVFDGFLRHLAAILAEDGLIDAKGFWKIVGDVIAEHADDHPELAPAAARYDLFRPEFRHSCLNRLQLRNTLQMVDLTDQAESLIFAGTLINPIRR